MMRNCTESFDRYIFGVEPQIVTSVVYLTLASLGNQLEDLELHGVAEPTQPRDKSWFDPNYLGG
jgi:hypothetical protein